MRKSLVYSLLCGVVALAGAGAPSWAGTPPPPTIPAIRPDPKAVSDFSKSLVRVNCTSQEYNLFRPWIKKTPVSRRGLGVVVGPNQVLVTAELVQNYTYIEFERPASGERSPAKLLYVDYEVNLALLAAIDPEFLASAVPLSLDETAKVGSGAEILQLESNGVIAPTQAKITAITVAPYVLEDVGFLEFRLTAPIQQREGSFVLPTVRDGRLLGLLMRYDSRNQTADVIPPEVIARFLQGVQSESYAVFPRAGVGTAPLRDPQLRRYLGLKENNGVFVSRVDAGGAAEKAGLKVGDVLLAIDDKTIDSDGNFSHIAYGRIPMGYLISSVKKAGETVKFKVYRDGEEKELSAVLGKRDLAALSVPPSYFDRQPPYLVAGGLVFQELSQDYLREWGNDWRKVAPDRLVNSEQFQNELFSGGQKVVFLSGVMPTPATLGYEWLSGLVVEEANGKGIGSLAELKAALDGKENGLHEIRLKDDPRFLYLDAELAKRVEPILVEQYGIRQMTNLPDGSQRKQEGAATPAQKTPEKTGEVLPGSSGGASGTSGESSAPAEAGVAP